MDAQDIGTSVSEASTLPKSGQSEAVSWPSTSHFRPVTMRYEGKVYGLRIYCKDGQNKGHRHIVMAKVDGRLLRAEGGSESEAQAAFIKLIDPEVEVVKDKDGRRLA